MRELQSLAEKGLLVDEMDSYGRTGLMEAVITGKNNIIKLFLDRGADTNAQDHNGYSALHFAAQDFRPEAARLILNTNAKVDIQDKYGNSPLWRAVFNSEGRGEVIRELLSHGADPDLKNKSGVSPRQLAQTIANYDVKQFFR